MEQTDQQLDLATLILMFASRQAVAFQNIPTNRETAGLNLELCIYYITYKRGHGNLASGKVQS